MGGNGLRGQIVLISMLILWAFVVQGAASLQATGLDIVGSRASNTTINAPDGMLVELNIVGSTASNSQIGYLIEVVNKTIGKECRGCGPCGEEKCYNTLWDDFKRPLCYPWSSYISTRYNQLFIKKTSPNIFVFGKGTTNT
jgi:hypothetical protein